VVLVVRVVVLNGSGTLHGTLLLDDRRASGSNV
jgi:hypothetical protein